jgi:ribosomal protein S3
MGRIGVKVWIYNGDIMPPPPEEAMEDLETIEVSIPSEDEDDAATEAIEAPEGS